MAIRIENQEILENNENLNIVNREIEHQKDEIEEQNNEIKFQNAEINLQNEEIEAQDDEIKKEIKQEIKKELNEEIKNQIKNPTEEVIIIGVEKPKTEVKKIDEKKNKIIPQTQNPKLCPECQKKYEQEMQAQYEEYPNYVVEEEIYQYEQPQYYQEYENMNKQTKTFQPTLYTPKDYQKLLKMAKPMFKVINKK